MPKSKSTPKQKTAPQQETGGGCQQGPCSPSAAELAFIKRINAAKPGTLIKVRLWTDECGSSMETHAKSITAAMKLIRGHAEFYANWSLEFISEANK